MDEPSNLNLQTGPAAVGRDSADLDLTDRERAFLEEPSVRHCIEFARALVSRQQLARACEILRVGLRTQPDHRDLRLMLGEALYVRRQLAACTRELARLLTYHPQDVGAMKLLGRALVDDGQPAEAWVVLRRAQDTSPNDRETARLLHRAAAITKAKRKRGDGSVELPDPLDALSGRPAPPRPAFTGYIRAAAQVEVVSAVPGGTGASVIIDHEYRSELADNRLKASSDDDAFSSGQRDAAAALFEVAPLGRVTPDAPSAQSNLQEGPDDSAGSSASSLDASAEASASSSGGGARRRGPPEPRPRPAAAAGEPFPDEDPSQDVYALTQPAPGPHPYTGGGTRESLSPSLMPQPAGPADSAEEQTHHELVSPASLVGAKPEPSLTGDDSLDEPTAADSPFGIPAGQEIRAAWLSAVTEGHRAARDSVDRQLRSGSTASAGPSFTAEGAAPPDGFDADEQTAVGEALPMDPPRAVSSSVEWLIPVPDVAIELGTDHEGVPAPTAREAVSPTTLEPVTAGAARERPRPRSVDVELEFGDPTGAMADAMADADDPGPTALGLSPGLAAVAGPAPRGPLRGRPAPPGSEPPEDGAEATDTAAASIPPPAAAPPGPPRGTAPLAKPRGRAYGGRPPSIPEWDLSESEDVISSAIVIPLPGESLGDLDPRVRPMHARRGEDAGQPGRGARPADAPGASSIELPRFAWEDDGDAAGPASPPVARARGRQPAEAEPAAAPGGLRRPATVHLPRRRAGSASPSDSGPERSSDRSEPAAAPVDPPAATAGKPPRPAPFERAGPPAYPDVKLRELVSGNDGGPRDIVSAEQAVDLPPTSLSAPEPPTAEGISPGIVYAQLLEVPFDPAEFAHMPPKPTPIATHPPPEDLSALEGLSREFQVPMDPHHDLPPTSAGMEAAELARGAGLASPLPSPGFAGGPPVAAPARSGPPPPPPQAARGPIPPRRPPSAGPTAGLDAHALEPAARGPIPPRRPALAAPPALPAGGPAPMPPAPPPRSVPPARVAARSAAAPAPPGAGLSAASMEVSRFDALGALVGEHRPAAAPAGRPTELDGRPRLAGGAGVGRGRVAIWAGLVAALALLLAVVWSYRATVGDLDRERDEARAALVFPSYSKRVQLSAALAEPPGGGALARLGGVVAQSFGGEGLTRREQARSALRARIEAERVALFGDRARLEAAQAAIAATPALEGAAAVDLAVARTLLALDQGGAEAASAVFGGLPEGVRNSANLQYVDALIALREGDRRRATDRARTAVQLDERLLAARRLTIELNAARGDHSSALDDFEVLLAAWPQDVDAQIAMHRLRVQVDKRSAESIAALEQLLERTDEPLGPLQIAHVQDTIGQHAARHGEVLRARTAFQAAQAAAPHDPRFSIGLARLSMRAFDLDEAEAALQRALEAAPRSANLRIELARLHLLRGDPARSLEMLTAIEEPDAEALHVRAQAHLALDQPKDAESSLTSASALDPGSVDITVRRHLAAVLRNNQPESRLAELRALLNAQPTGEQRLEDRALPYRAYGLALSHLDRKKDAIKQLERALHVNPEDFLALSELCNLVAHEGEVREALRLCRRACEINPHYAPAAERGAAIAEAYQDHGAVKAMLKPVVERGRARPEVIRRLARARVKQRELDEALALAEIDLSDDGATQRYIRGLVANARGDTATAGEMLALVAAQLERDAWAQLAYAEYLARRGDTSQAIVYYRLAFRDPVAGPEAAVGAARAALAQRAWTDARTFARQAERSPAGGTIQPRLQAEAIALSGHALVLSRDRRSYREARQLFSQAQQIERDLPTTLLGEGLLAQEEGRLSEATARFRRAADVAPEDPEILYRLGRLWFVEDETRAEGRARLEQVIELDGNGVWGARARSTLEGGAR